MKNKLTLLFIILIIAFNSLYSEEEFTISRLTIDFKGAVNYNGEIIVFGNSGDFIISNDMGETWQRKHIFTDTVSIVNLVEFQGDLVGATTEGTVFRLDKNYNLLNKFTKYSGIGVTHIEKMTDTTIGISSNDYSFSIINNDFKDLYPFKAKTFGATPFIKFVTNDNGILIAVTDLSIWIINPYNSNFKSNRVDDLGVGNKIYDIYKINDIIFVKVDSSLYKFDADSLKFSLFYSKVPNGPLLYEEGYYYFLFTEKHKEYNLGTVTMNQIEGNKLYQTSLLNYERYILNNFSIKNYIQIDNTIIAVGSNNSIFKSNDNGFKWEAISNFSSKYFHLWLNDSTGFWSNDYQQVFKTKNYGATFLPQKFTDSLIILNSSAYQFASSFYLNQDGNGFIWFRKDESKIFNDDLIVNYMYTNDFGETYKSKWINDKADKHILFFADDFNLNALNFNEDILFYVNKTFADNKYTYIYKFNADRFNIDSLSTIYYDSTHIKFICKYNNFLYSYVDNDTGKYILKSNDLENWEEVVNLNKFSSTKEIAKLMSTYFSEVINFENSSKFILTFADTLFEQNPKFDGSLNLIDPNFRKYGIISNLLIDLENNIFKLLSKDTLDYSGVLEVENGKYVPRFKPGIIKKTYSQPFLYEKDFVCFQNWEYYSYNSSYKIDISDINSDNWEPHNLSLNLIDIRKYLGISTQTNVYPQFQKVSENKFIYGRTILETNSFPSTKVEENIEKGDNYYYQYLSYPQPANEFVTTKIVTNNFECLIKENLKIFNSMGNDITIADEIEIFKLSDYEYQLKWHCSNYPSGIYFIKTNCSNNQIIKLIKE